MEQHDIFPAIWFIGNIRKQSVEVSDASNFFPNGDGKLVYLIFFSIFPVILEIIGVKNLIQKAKVICFLQPLKLKKTKCLYFLNQRLSRENIAILLRGIKPLYRRARLNR